MVNLFQAVILSVVQGITEWLPISSSGHLALLQHYFGFQNLPFDVFLHFASIFAIIAIFWKDLIKLSDISDKKNLRFILLILIGIIPAGIVGVLFKDSIEGFFSSLFYLGIFFMVSGILVFSTKFSKEKKEKISIIDSIRIGLFQACSIVPGISRSGATISGALLTGINKKNAVKFSFFMAIPIILGASLLELRNLNFNEISIFVLTISFIVTLLVSIFTIKLLMKIINSDKFYLFGIYNFLLGLIIIIFERFFS